MTRKSIPVLVILLLASVSAFAQSPASAPWVDYVAGDYDMVPNITYATANNTQLSLDLYLPKMRATPLPTLVFYHGGGWVGGQKERNVFQLLPYLSLGWAVVNVEYRLASNSLAPAAVEDCLCALRWVGSHAKEYNFDTTKIVLTGGSAGGHLALITGMLPQDSPFYRPCATDEKIRWKEGWEPRVRVAAIVNWYGITDVAELLEGPNAKHYAIEWFGGMPHRKELAQQLSPLMYVRAGLPPIISIHGDDDDIVPYSQATRLHAGLDRVGVPNTLIPVKGGKHDGFDRQTLVNSFAAIREFLRKNAVLPKE
jgi:acetyl esterase/lipase